MMSNMFCFQCQQTAGNKGCVRTGVCGKQPETANLQDELVQELIRLAQSCIENDRYSRLSARLLIDGLFTTLTNVNFDNASIRHFIDRVIAERKAAGGSDIPVVALWKGETDIVSLRSTLLFGLKGMAAYAHHSMNLGYEDDSVTKWFYKGLYEISRTHTVEEWLTLIMEFGKINLQCMELLDRANTESFGTPVPTRVNTDIKKGPFIVVSGHDLKDQAGRELARIFCQNAAEQSVTGWMVTYFKGSGIITGALAAYTVTVMWGATLVARLLIAFVFPFKQPRKAMVVMGVSCTIFYILLVQARSQGAAIVLLFAFAFAMAGMNPTAVASAGKMTSVTSMGIMLPVASSGAILMPWVIGKVAESAGLAVGMATNIVPCVGLIIFAVLVARMREE